LISEKEVSILIPAYSQLEMTRVAIACALATRAGEIIVSIDKGGESLKELLLCFDDPRLRFYTQKKNIGVWANHYFLMNHSTKPWIKFLQTDDYMGKNCLKTMCRVANENTSIVGCLPIYRNLDTGYIWYNETSIKRQQTWKSSEYLERIMIVGNELGRPSYTLFRADILQKNFEYWINECSADLIMNIFAASRGHVTLLPIGLIVTGEHLNREGRLASLQLTIKRGKNTIYLLKKADDSRVRDVANVLCFLEVFSIFVNIVGVLKRSQNPYYKGLPKDIIDVVKMISIKPVIGHFRQIASAIRYRYLCFNKKSANVR
jgi:hypothetical protein